MLKTKDKNSDKSLSELKIKNNDRIILMRKPQLAKKAKINTINTNNNNNYTNNAKNNNNDNSTNNNTNTNDNDNKIVIVILYLISLNTVAN